MVLHGENKRTEQAGGTPSATRSSRLFTRGSNLRVAAAAGAAVAACWAMSPGAAHAEAASASTGTAAAAMTTASIRPHSGLSWASGVYLPGATPATVSAFARWRGRPVDTVVVWLGRSSWTSITDPAWLYQRWIGSGYPMVFSVPMLPDVPGVSIQACANGDYNWRWRQFGSVIRSYGFGYSIIRLGWEFNGDWYSWNASDPAAWAQCWRQAVTSARSTAPHLRWDWNANRGVSSALASPARAYPGNAYVNMIGVDSYDWWLPATTSAGWQKQLNGPQGLNYWLAFAKAHGKLLSVPEWGNLRYGKTAGGDDPAYVNDMRAFFAANARYISFEANFQNPAITGASYLNDNVPRAAAAYRKDF